MDLLFHDGGAESVEGVAAAAEEDGGEDQAEESPSEFHGAPAVLVSGAFLGAVEVDQIVAAFAHVASVDIGVVAVFALVYHAIRVRCDAGDHEGCQD